MYDTRTFKPVFKPDKQRSSQNMRCLLYTSEEYYTYTTEETEKLELFRLTEKLGGNIELAIKQLADSKRNQHL